ncbi:MAG: proline dehydrogenase family protein [Acidobacteria bacterium]|nr:proline dehydrogenase family protein [Acidobacteriota bacterium]
MSLKQRLVNLTPGRLVRLFAAPYIAGDSAAKAVETARTLWDSRGVRSTLDLLGEDLREDGEGERSLAAYHRLLEILGPQPFATLSLKPTQFAAGGEPGPYRRRIGEIARAALSKGIGVTLDMEDHRFTDLTLGVYRDLLPEVPGLGTVLQSRLHRTREDILALRGLAARVRICIGIYLEPPDIALRQKPAMKERLVEFTGLLLDGGHYVEIATHDEAVLDRALAVAERLNPRRDRFEVQMLLGVPRLRVQDELVRRGVRVRLYVPYAENWKDAVGYCKRRLAANPSMGAQVLRNLFRR